MADDKIEPQVKEDVKDSKDLSSTGIKAVLDRATQAYDKLPMLEIVYERLLRTLTTSLRNLTSENVEIKIVELQSLRFGGYFSNIKPPLSIAVFRAIEWDNLGLIVLDSSLVLFFVDLLLGGKKGAVPQPRPLTYIEQTLAKQLVEIILTELGQAFDAVSSANFLFERLESNPHFATICRPGDAVIILKLQVQIEERGGTVDLVLPYNTIEPIKEQLQQVFIGDKFGIDSAWEELLTRRVYETELDLEAVVLNTPSKMSEVANLKPGDTIVINHRQDEDILVRCENIVLFKGQIGKVEDKIAINVTNVVARG